MELLLCFSAISFCKTIIGFILHFHLCCIEKSYFFQALIIIVCSVGCEKTFCDLLPKYPGLVLIPIFSCFTFGPIDKKSSKCCDLSCQNEERSLGVSFALTWLNMCITAICVMPLIVSYTNSYPEADWYGGLLFLLIAGKMIFFWL